MGGDRIEVGGLWVQGRLRAWGRKAPASLCPCRGSSGVQNGLLVVNTLMESHRGLAEQLASCGLAAVLQSCWWDGQSSGCPHATLALRAINRLAEQRLPLGPQTAGSVRPAPRHAVAPLARRAPGLGPRVLVVAGREAPLDPRDVRALLGGLGDGVLSKDVVVALERQLCGEGPVPSGEVAQLLRDRGCFRLLLRSFELLEAEKGTSLSILRWVRGAWWGSGASTAGMRVLVVMPGGHGVCWWLLVGLLSFTGGRWGC